MLLCLPRVQVVRSIEIRSYYYSVQIIHEGEMWRPSGAILTVKGGVLITLLLVELSDFNSFR